MWWQVHVVLHVTVGAAYSLVLLVYLLLAEVLVDWPRAVFSLRVEEGGVEVGFANVSPFERSLDGILCEV